MGVLLPTSPQPTLAGFTAWVYGVMGVPSAWLPSDSPSIFYAYNTSLATVNPKFKCVPGPIYLQMVYNLGGHMLATWAPDPTFDPNDAPAGNPPHPYRIDDKTGYGFFQWLRKQNNILGFTAGTVQSSGDEGSSVGMVVPKQAENLTVAQLQLQTTFWGRWYLGQAQAYGTNWGMS